MAEKRGLLIILVIATIVVFIGLVWAIVTYMPLISAASPSPSDTAEAQLSGLNCTLPVTYWLQHPEYYPRELVMGDKTYGEGEISQILNRQGKDLPVKLQAQLVTAYLNISSGAQPDYIQTTIFEAYGWLIKHPAGNEILAGDQQDGTRLLNLLEAYNLGQTGVEPCETAYLTQQAETRQAPESETPTATNTPSPTETTIASETPQPTSTETYAPVYTVVIPSKMPTKTTQAPAYPTLRPTTTTAPTNPPPTNTFAPTEKPDPTNTPQPPKPTETFSPPPTATFTLPPLPSATYTLPPPP